jgi:hypothetical protein
MAWRSRLDLDEIPRRYVSVSLKSPRVLTLHSNSCNRSDGQIGWVGCYRIPDVHGYVYPVDSLESAVVEMATSTGITHAFL